LKNNFFWGTFFRELNVNPFVLIKSISIYIHQPFSNVMEALLKMTQREKEHIFAHELFPKMEMVLRFARQWTRDEQNAADLTQEAFSKAWQNIEKYIPGTNAAAWLYTITYRIFVSDKRKNTPHIEAFEDYTTFNEAEDEAVSAIKGFSSELTDVLFEQVFGDEINSALEKINPNFSVPFIMSHIEGYQYDEIATILSIPIGTVRSRINRGSKKLREELTNFGKSKGYCTDDTAK
jgi:RNA polymerase sigma-70 factor, ECF subfamily